MMRRIIRIASMAAAFLILAAANAHAQKPEDCKKTLTALGVAESQHSSDPCFVLAVLVTQTAAPVTSAADMFLKDARLPSTSIFSPRDLQPRHTQQPALAGTAAQGHAIPGVQPVGVAAGTIAAVGTNAGTDALAAVTVNPAVLALGDEASRQLARASRIADVTVFLPVSDISGDDAPTEKKTPKYFGVRVRLNLTGARAGDEVWSGAAALFSNWLSRNRANQVRVQELLAHAPDLTRCASDLIHLNTTSGADLVADCGSSFAFDVDLAEAARLRELLAGVRRRADSKYFGADFRFDEGDPTLGEEADASGTFLFAGLAFGRRFAGSVAGGAWYGMRGRFGFRHAKLDTVDKAEMAFEGAGGFEFSRALDDQEINGSIGVEFRHGNGASDAIAALQTNYGMIRGSLVLPVAAGNSMSLIVGVPIWGDMSPTLSVNFNWGLLLPGLPKR